MSSLTRLRARVRRRSAFQRAARADPRRALPCARAENKSGHQSAQSGDEAAAGNGTGTGIHSAERHQVGDGSSTCCAVNMASRATVPPPVEPFRAVVGGHDGVRFTRSESTMRKCAFVLRQPRADAVQRGREMIARWQPRALRQTGAHLARAAAVEVVARGCARSSRRAMRPREGRHPCVPDQAASWANRQPPRRCGSARDYTLRLLCTTSCARAQRLRAHWGNLAPPLNGVGARLSKTNALAHLRLAAAVNRDSIMPSYYRNGRPRPGWRNRERGSPY